MSVLPPTFAELVAESGQIVRGRVIAVEPFHATTRDGRPVIKTRVTWELDTTLKGSPTTPLTLVFLGGRIGTETLAVPGMPQFAVGNEDFLFVEPNHEVICPLIAAGHGRYRVQLNPATGQRFVARQNGQPLTDPARVAEPLASATASSTAAGTPAATPLTPEAFESAIRSAVQPSTAVPNAR